MELKVTIYMEVEPFPGKDPTDIPYQLADAINAMLPIKGVASGEVIELNVLDAEIQDDRYE